jgi:hypothetical protein
VKSNDWRYMLQIKEIESEVGRIVGEASRGANGSWAAKCTVYLYRDEPVGTAGSPISVQVKQRQFMTSEDACQAACDAGLEWFQLHLPLP